MTGFQVGFGLLATLAGSFFVLVGWGMRRTRLEQERRGVVTEGTVVGSQWASPGVTAGRPSLVAYPVVEFRDGDGTPRRFLHRAGTNRRPSEGRRVAVWYDPLRPDEDPVIHRETVMVLGPVLLMAVGVLFLAAVAASVVLTVGRP